MDNDEIEKIRQALRELEDDLRADSQDGSLTKTQREAFKVIRDRLLTAGVWRYGPQKMYEDHYVDRS